MMTKLKTGNPEGFQGKNGKERGTNGATMPEMAGTWEGHTLPEYALEPLRAARAPKGIHLRSSRNNGYLLYDPDLHRVRAEIELRRKGLTDVSL